MELPEAGTKVTQGGAFGNVESVKATSDVNSPISGEVVEVNEKLSGTPGLVRYAIHQQCLASADNAKFFHVRVVILISCWVFVAMNLNRW